MSTIVTQILDRLDTILKANVPLGTQVFRERTDAVSREEAPCVNVLVRDDAAEAFGDDYDRHEVSVELRLVVRDDTPTPVVEALHAVIHAPIVGDGQLLDLVASVRLGDASYEREEADLTSLIKAVSYRFKHAIPENTL